MYETPASTWEAPAVPPAVVLHRKKWGTRLLHRMSSLNPRRRMKGEVEAGCYRDATAQVWGLCRLRSGGDLV